MGLITHQHAETSAQLPKLSGRKMAVVGSGWVVLSTQGETVLWSTGFAGCVGLVLCGPNGEGGMLAHINQTIQDRGMDYDLALQRVAEFYAKNRMDNKPTDVLIFFGDPQLRNPNQTPVDTIKARMGCTTVTDLRRQDTPELYGNEFIYDPKAQIVYTIKPGVEKYGIVGAMLGEDPDEFPLKAKPWQYESTEEQAKLKGLGGEKRGWEIVP